MLELARRRLAARQARDFAAADDLRDKIVELGWLVTDTATGYALVPAPAQPSARRPPKDKVLANPAAIPSAGPELPTGSTRLATVGLLVEGWPDDLRECVYEAETLTRLGDTRQAAGEHAQASDAWQQALAILEDIQHPHAAKVRAKLVDTVDRASPTPSA